MEYFLVFVAGMAVSMLILRWATNRAIDRILDRMAREEDNVDAVAKDAVGMELRVEFDQNTYYCYNTQDDTFVCQGNNFAELQTNFHRRYPGAKGVIVEGDEASSAWLKAETSKNFG